MVAEQDQGRGEAVGQWQGGAVEQAGAVWRRLPVGAEPVPGGGVHFRVWAPKHRVVEVGARSRSWISRDGRAARRRPNGYFAGTAPAAAAGTGYRFPATAGRARASASGADPASRFQPEGPHGPSRGGRSLGLPLGRPGLARVESIEGQVLYELHVGTFTPAGHLGRRRGAAPLPRRARGHCRSR